MISCALIEDDKNTITMLKSIIEENFDAINVIGSASSINGAYELITNTNPTFIFLDVNLEDGDGFEILNKFNSPKFTVIFITSYSKYAVEAFKFSAIDFVLKPFSPSDIIKAVNKVIQEEHKNYLEKITTLYHNHTSGQKKIILSNSDSIHVVSLEDILYAKSDNSYTTFFTIDKREILVSKSLKSFDDQLSSYFFFRIHQKYLINLQHIKKFNKRNDEIVLINDTSLPVSQGKKADLLHLLKSSS
ncbi:MULTISPECIES: LytR/AlgR family response regulator transcription factor [unclassified Tenacibaculum]|uniref:LytR/AlgR family response regulator transcription factor n=1 Tax=Tenacibaculum TaxID=104267 RepID=UPI000895C992|nr:MULTISPECIES: LytTR family DNA-binding domain-containing protein [unclassified Tenacibaculum]RBW60846.1 DNA-binding response regulator [Tenacibaculum sp. E3R01]SEE58072.1 two component transcriptional regulator, LytTR family [Tenacibaculum sp. MAR_2010_89]